MLVYAYRDDTADHASYRDWLEAAANSPEALGISELILSGFVRVVTHPRIFSVPTPLGEALEQAGSLLDAPAAVAARSGALHWEIFTRLCAESRATGNLVSDAYQAALAIEAGATFVTTDGDYSRFKGLRHMHPLGN